MHDLLFTAIKAAVLSGEKIIETKQKGFDIETKKDNSPVTIADLASNKVIMDILSSTSFPILSEENKIMDYSVRKDWETMWIVDPLDGTKEFIANRDEYTTNIALFKNGKIVLGVVFVPELKTLYFAEDKLGSYKATNVVSSKLESLSELINNSFTLPIVNPSRDFVVVASRSHQSPETKEFIDKLQKELGNIQIESYGSSLKLCKVAEGTAKIYPRLGPTMEWDIAASIAIVKYAGMEVLQYPTLVEVEFNKENLLNPYFIVFPKEFNALIKSCI